MHRRILDKINAILLYLEQKFGLFATSLIIAFFLLCIAAIYVTPAFAPMQLGRGYSYLSVNPFDFSEQNNLRFRILTPFLAYCVGLRGPLYIIFPLIIAVFFLSVVYIYLRKKTSLGIPESFLICMVICFSSPVLFLLHFQGYVDVMSYLMMVWMIIFIKKPVIWIPLIALLLLNHESNLFIIPALLFFYYINMSNKTTAVLTILSGVAFALIPFYLYRNFISEVSPVELTFATYAAHIKDNVKTIAPCVSIGFFYAFKLFWLFPLLAIYYHRKEKNYNQLLFFMLILIGTLGQLLVASDTSRLIGLAFPIILFSAIKIKEVWGTQLFLKRTFYLILANLLIPQYYVGQSVMIRFYPLPSSYILKHFFGIETWVG